MMRQANPDPSPDHTLAFAAAQLSSDPRVTAMISQATSGEHALHLSQVRSMTPLIGLNTDLKTVRKLSLAWGVHNVLFDPDKDKQTPNEKAIDIALDMRIAARDDTIVLVLWRTEGDAQSQHDIRLLKIKSDPKEQSLLD